MTSLLATRPPTLFDDPAAESTGLDGPGGEPTLDQLITSVWEGLTAHLVVSCPVCDSDMNPAYAANGQLTQGRCSSCGTTIS